MSPKLLAIIAISCGVLGILSMLRSWQQGRRGRPSTEEVIEVFLASAAVVSGVQVCMVAVIANLPQSLDPVFVFLAGVVLIWHSLMIVVRLVQPISMRTPIRSTDA